MTQIADAQDNPIGFDDIYSGEDIRFLYPDNLFKETWDKEEFQDAINHTVELWAKLRPRHMGWAWMDNRT